MRATIATMPNARRRSEEHTSELQSRVELVCRLLLEKKTTRYGASSSICSSSMSKETPSHVVSRFDHLVTQCMSTVIVLLGRLFFFFNDTATTEIYTLSLHDALPI